jgi:para-nitrobenzyl esterase
MSLGNFGGEKQMSRFDRRSLLGYSFWGAGLALAGLPTAVTGAVTGSPDAGGTDRWIIDDTSAVADTDSGKVVGYVRNDIRIFKGIPYAEILSPAGRWKRGAKVRPWAGKRSSRAQGFVCPAQNGSPIDEAALRDSDYRERTSSGEDCLRINVWTPGTDNKKRQVLFYCHGGGYNGGSALMGLRYEGHNLAKYGDVVVVSMNHRLHALGFLDLTAYGSRWADSANVGMLDIVDALKWVQTNIANFGGDPAKVMISGQSGGGSKVLALLSMPEAKGLFNRAVSHSGAPMPLATEERSAARTASFLKLVGVSPNNLDALYELPVETLVRSATTMQAAFQTSRDRFDGWGTADAENGWRPVVDGRTVADDPTLPKIASDVPLMLGTTLHESFVALGDPEYPGMKEPQARAIVRVAFGPAGDSIYDVYKGAFPKAIPYELSAMARAMGHFRAHSVKIAQRRAAHNAAPTYDYWFQWRANTFEGRAMSHHEIDMPFVFLNSDAVPTVTGGTAEARALSLKMADAWLAFAHTGNPNTKALPNWSPVTPTAMTTMVFDNSCRIDHGSDLAAIETYWKNRYPHA